MSKPESYYLPKNVAKQVQSELGLSEQQHDVLLRELNRADQDALLVLQANPAWPQDQQYVEYDAVCDAMATFDTGGSGRRDRNEGCHRWIFHFNMAQDITPCRRALLRRFRGAFGMSPWCWEVTRALSTEFQTRPQPMAVVVLVIKQAVRQDDASVFPFFYF